MASGLKFEANAEIGSVRLELTGAKPVTKTESMAPYSLYGDDADGLNGSRCRQVNIPFGPPPIRSVEGTEMNWDRWRSRSR